MASRAGIHVSHGTIIIGESLLAWLPPPGHCTVRRLKPAPSLSVTKAYLLDLELYSEGRDLV